MTPWDALGVSQDIAVADLRRRYASLIKEFRPETHPQDFARIREAYEVALPFARQREFEAAQEAEAQAAVEIEGSPTGMGDLDVDEAVDAAPAQPILATAASIEIVDTVPLAIDDEIALPTAAIAALPDIAYAAPQTSEREPDLAEHFRRFHALAESATGTSDEALLPALRSLLQARSQASLDDSQALEFALMRWFIESTAPPLTLLFETGRAFDWHAHVVRLSTWLSPWALRQMEARLALSRDLVYARHFSGNASLRQLHSPRSGMRLLVLRPPALEAHAWAERWRHASEDADAVALADCLDARSLGRLRGFASTDVLVGLGVASFASDATTAAVWGVATTALVFLSRRVLQAIGRLPPTHRIARAARVIGNNLRVVGVLSAVVGVLGAIVLAPPEADAFAIAPGIVLIAPAVLFALTLAWRVAAYLELVVAWPFLWREAVDRLEFDRFLNSRVASPEGRPFGTRLGFIERLKAIRPALAFQDKEIASRARPPRAKPSRLFRFTGLGGKPSLGRMLWFGAWILFAILRIVHAFGDGH